MVCLVLSFASDWLKVCCVTSKPIEKRSRQRKTRYYAVLLVTFHCDGSSEEIALLFKIISVKISVFFIVDVTPKSKSYL